MNNLSNISCSSAEVMSGHLRVSVHGYSGAPLLNGTISGLRGHEVNLRGAKLCPLALNNTIYLIPRKLWLCSKMAESNWTVAELGLY